MKIAIVHDMLIKLGGAENVLSDLLELYPEADLFTLIYDEDRVGSMFPRERVKFVPKIAQRIYNIFKKQYLCLPFLARAVEALDLSDYDVVISSSNSFAHGCLTKPETLHVVYYHSPARYLWDYTHQYERDMSGSKGIKAMLFKIANWTILKPLFVKLRQWDYMAGQRHDIAIANAREVQARIAKYYRRESQVIYPAVYTDKFDIGPAALADRSYYFIVGALTEFKKVDLAIKACNDLGYPLVIIGSGDQEAYLRSIAGPTIQILGRRPDSEKVEYLRNARGFILAGKEDFGITPIEAMAAGVPVFGLRAGGLLETNVE
jgi:glycosyltransferase involved in cell wall biosynthesis